MEGTSGPDRPISPRTTISPAGWLGAVGTQPSGSVLQLLKVHLTWLLTWARRTCLDPAILPPPSAFPRHGLERTRVGGRGKRGGREGGRGMGNRTMGWHAMNLFRSSAVR